ncbi:acetyltransferase [Halobacillus halophilus]|uniref:acetyltransferase n=1 Tax=Halobacillus halophilus TaxID=1570 RepID=UPI00136C6187|nr:acetyltransferase [Halobacillus halophilus]MYL30802.1 acetyltransferase [Halobacillus halophilus]
MELVALIGCGGHAKVVEQMVEQSFTKVKIVAKLDDRFTNRFFKRGVLYGPIEEIFKLIHYGVKMIVAIGDNRIRKKVVTRLNLHEEHYTNLIHLKAVVADDLEIGKGTVIMPGAIINADVEISSHCIINSGCIVEHDNRIGPFAHICPGAVMTGNVHLKEGVMLGANSTILPGLEIGSWSTVGAGSTVTRSMAGHITAVGSPALEVGT